MVATLSVSEDLFYLSFKCMYSPVCRVLIAQNLYFLSSSLQKQLGINFITQHVATQPDSLQSTELVEDGWQPECSSTHTEITDAHKEPSLLWAHKYDLSKGMVTETTDVVPSGGLTLEIPELTKTVYIKKVISKNGST